MNVPVYRFDVLSALKDKGYNTGLIRKNNLLPQSTLQKLRTGKMVSMESIIKLCQLLECQPGDILELKEPEEPEEPEE